MYLVPVCGRLVSDVLYGRKFIDSDKIPGNVIVQQVYHT